MELERYLAVQRMTKLGRVGESLAEERLLLAGFSDIENLNLRQMNYPFADILATRDGKRYLIGVKTRNELQAKGSINSSYNLVKIATPVRRRLHEQGVSTDEITALLLTQVRSLADRLQAIPAWVTVAVRPKDSTYSAYFGLIEALGQKRSIPMTIRDRQSYEVLGEAVSDPRITPDLCNQILPPL